MLDVLHVLGSGRPESTGMARIVTTLAKGLPRERYRLHAWFLEDGGLLEEDLRAAGVQTRVVRWCGGKRDPLGALRFCKTLRSQRFAIVHQHVGGRSLRWVARAASDARAIVHVHGRFDEANLRVAAPSAMLGADAVIAVSEAVARQVRSGPVDVVYPGTFVAGSTPTTPATRGRDFVIGTACRLEHVKGIADLLEAVAKLRGSIRLEIAGSGSQQPELVQLSRRLGIEQSVKFLGWRSDLQERMVGWHAYAQPSLDEGFGLAALEAMAAGVPVIATRVGGLAELVRDGETGLLVTPRHPLELSMAIAALQGNENRRLAMARAARARALAHFDAVRMSEQIEAIYSRVLASSRPDA